MHSWQQGFAKTSFLISSASSPRTSKRLLPRLPIPTRERVLLITLDNIHPPIIPEVVVIPFKSSEAIADPDRAVVVARVHESEDTPHAVENRTAVYRRVDNISERLVRKATIGEIEWLINKRAKSLAEKERISNKVQDHAEECRRRRFLSRTREPLLERGRFRFYTVPCYPRAPIVERRKLVEIARRAATQIPAVPSTLPSGQARAVPGGVIFEGIYGASEYQQQGMIYHSFDFWWDEDHKASSTPKLRNVFPSVCAAFLWGMLEFAGKLYSSVGFASLLDLEFRLEGVRDAVFAERPHGFSSSAPIINDSISVRRTLLLSDIVSRGMEIAEDALRELYWDCGIDPSDERVKRNFAGQGLE